MPISCWPVWAEAVEQQGWGVMEIQQIELTEKKKLPLHKLHGFSGDKNHSMVLLTTAVHFYMHL